ncbi:Smr/MutS family protein [Myxococcota bacterium]|nr:Smr/MutS family protein [Myxococcota bacterium]
MSRRSRKSQTPGEPPASDAFSLPREPFSSPFKAVEDQLKSTVRKVPKPVAPKPAPPPAPPTETDEQLLARAYHGVKPVKAPARVAPSAPKPDVIMPLRDESDSVLAELSDLVDGRGEFDIESLDEFVTGLAPGVDRRLLDQLRKGQFSVQDHLDLHGFTWSEAREEILGFVNRAAISQKRCVLIIHGRGLHSKTPVPVLRDGLLALLTRGPLRRRILAFSTARPVDGGPGSMYLLLRRPRLDG